MSHNNSSLCWLRLCDARRIRCGNPSRLGQSSLVCVRFVSSRFVGSSAELGAQGSHSELSGLVNRITRGLYGTIVGTAFAGL
ncbi:Hypothetical protein Bdt_1585 [Bdellovibrio bacteriovorus str. Tiberius]|uniref:Uncharacterized protein n=1 Tax=Bdellovibrio bacteriovorus str. Tiberius TaxID=1069642 RepID=K7YX30_BDEBC|nr:Hypothetical protein Bdt_1585 [Bdellovibrio bacteriovorus str. Tiberius]